MKARWVSVPAVVSLMLLTSGCGLFSGADETVYTMNWRQPEPLEKDYIALANIMESEKPCYLIHPESMRVSGFNSPGTKASLTRSSCFDVAAMVTNDVSLCDQVRSVSHLFYSGASLNRDNCIQSAQGNVGYSFNLEIAKMLDLMGYDDQQINAFLVDRGRFSSLEMAEYFQRNQSSIFWAEVRHYLLASEAFFDRIDLLPSFGSPEDRAAMQTVSWRFRPKRDMPLPETRLPTRQLPELQIQIPLEGE